MKVLYKLWNGRPIREEKIFEEEGKWAGKEAAEVWLLNRNYTIGKMCPSSDCVPIIKGTSHYDKTWKQLTQSDKAIIDGVMTSSDYKNGSVKVILFAEKTIL